MTGSFRGAEDFNFEPVGDVMVTTAVGRYRSGFARSGLASSNTGRYTAWRVLASLYPVAFTDLSWLSARFYLDGFDSGGDPTIVAFLFAGLPRLALQVMPGSALGADWGIYAIDAGGVGTLLAALSGPVPVATLARIDLMVNFAVAGEVAVYIDGTLLADWSGDLLSAGPPALEDRDFAGPCVWSEIIIGDEDTRHFAGLATQAPSADGFRDKWIAWPAMSTAVDDINEIETNDCNANYTFSFSGAVQEYKVNALPSGSWRVVDNTIAFRATRGPTAPSRIEGLWRTAGADYATDPVSEDGGFKNTQFIRETNPASGDAWTPAQLNEAGYNIGVQTPQLGPGIYVTGYLSNLGIAYTSVASTPATLLWANDYVEKDPFYVNLLGIGTLVRGQPLPIGQGFDAFGNYYMCGAPVFRPDGTANQPLYTNAILADMIDAWYGSAIVHRVTFLSNGAPAAAPILDGQFIVAYMQAGVIGTAAFQKWLAILAPAEDGSLTLLGAVFQANLTGLPYGGVRGLFVANTQTLDDPILMLGSYGLGATTSSVSVWPPARAIINGDYKDFGYPAPGLGPCWVPGAWWPFLVSANLSRNLGGFLGTTTSAFTLPAADGGTNLYFYFNHALMDDQAAGTWPSVVQCPELRNVLQPAYPTGCMLRIKMGTLDHVALADFAITHGGTLGGAALGGSFAYTVDNANWVDGLGAPQIPFSDEYHYISNGMAGGTDAYQMHPAAIDRLDNGHWRVVFVMAGIHDTRDNLLDPPATFTPAAGEQWDTLRMFDYDPATETATQTTTTSGIAFLWTAGDVITTSNRLVLPGAPQTNLPGVQIQPFGSQWNQGAADSWIRVRFVT